MKNYIKNEKGVTIMVLVITIIIMLILAAVSVDIATGNNAKDGVVQMTSKQRQDQFNMVYNESKSINEVIKNENGDDWGF